MARVKGSEAAKTLSLLGAAKGGEARAKALTPEERSRIARDAVEQRWRNAGKLRPLSERVSNPLQATHKGSFKNDFGIDVECYVLNDNAKTAVISQRGMGEALGLGKGGTRLGRFIQGQKISPYVGPELRKRLDQPLIFQGVSLGQNVHPHTIYGYDVTDLIDVCKAIVNAEGDGKILKAQVAFARQAHVILNASAKAGIKGLVYALSGYDASREEIIASFKMFVQEEAREYEKEFPDQLYAEWYRLYQLPKPERNKPWKFMHLTVDQVYRPLAKSNGRILQLTQAQRENSHARFKKLHQFLSEIGVKALRNHLGQLLGIARISNSQDEYESHFHTLFGEQLDLFRANPKVSQQ